MNKPLCAKCGHEEAEHEARLYGIECIGEPMDDDQPKWVTGRAAACQCEGYEEPKGKAA